MADERLTYTVSEVAGLLGLSRSATYRATASGEIPTVKIGGRVLVPRARLQELLDGVPAFSAEAMARFAQEWSEASVPGPDGLELMEATRFDG